MTMVGFLLIALGGFWSAPPALADDAVAAGSSFFGGGLSSTSSLSVTAFSTSPSLNFTTDATGTGRINSGIVYEGFFGSDAFSPSLSVPALAARTRFEQFSSAKGQFDFSVSFDFQSQMPSVGASSPFNQFFR